MRSTIRAKTRAKYVTASARAEFFQTQSLASGTKYEKVVKMLAVPLHRHVSLRAHTTECAVTKHELLGLRVLSHLHGAAPYVETQDHLRLVAAAVARCLQRSANASAERRRRHVELRQRWERGRHGR